MKKKKIVHIEDFFHPSAGYQVNILAKYMAKENFDVYIITAEFEKIPNYLTDFFGKDNIEKQDEEYTQKYGVKIIRLPLKTYISGRAIYTKQIWRVLKQIEPDILYVHGCDTYIGMQVLSKTKKFSARVLTDNHMVDVASKNPLRNFFRLYYKMMVTPHIKKNKIPVLRMVDDAFVKNRLGIPLELSPVISFGSDTMLFYPNETVKKEWRNEIGISEDSLVVCYAGKLDEYKGGQFLADAIVEGFDTEKKVEFLIIGNTSGQYGEKVENTFKESQNKILRFKTQKYEDLAKFYQCADVAVFPHACSLSFFDVQACGLPVISEDMNINVERCSHGNGFNFKETDVEDFREKIERFANMSNEELETMKKNSIAFIKEKYDYKNILLEYMQYF